jgi:uncharacterized protein YjbI with pentapeptide repeats
VDKPRQNRPRLDAVDPQDLEALDAREVTARERYDRVHIEGGGDHVDWQGVSLSEARVTDFAVLEEARLVGARISEVVFERAQITILSGDRITLQDVVIAGSRFGSADLSGAAIRGVKISDCKFGYLNLRGSELTDVLFERCTIDELDFYGARLDRVAFDNSRAGSLVLSGATTKSADLRGLDFDGFSGVEGFHGATISDVQLSLLAHAFATHLGIRVEG